MAALHISRASATTLPPPALHISRASAKATVTPKLHISRASAVAPTPPKCSAGSAQDDLEPFETITLAGTSPDSPDSWAWRQLDGPTVTITDADKQTATYEAPGTLDGATVTFGLTVTKNGVKSPEATVTHTVLYATDSVVWDGVLRPVQLLTAVDDGN